MGMRGRPHLLFAPDAQATEDTTGLYVNDRHMSKGPTAKHFTLIALAAIVLLMVPCFGLALGAGGGESTLGILFGLMGLITLLGIVAVACGLTWLIGSRREAFGNQLGLSSDEHKNGPKGAAQ